MSDVFLTTHREAEGWDVDAALGETCDLDVPGNVNRKENRDAAGFFSTAPFRAFGSECRSSRLSYVSVNVLILSKKRVCML